MPVYNNKFIRTKINICNNKINVRKCQMIIVIKLFYL